MNYIRNAVRNLIRIIYIADKETNQLTEEQKKALVKIYNRETLLRVTQVILRIASRYTVLVYFIQDTVFGDRHILNWLVWEAYRGGWFVGGWTFQDLIDAFLQGV